MASFHVVCGLGLPQPKILATPINWRPPKKIFEDLFFLENATAPVSLASSIAVLGLEGSVLGKAVLSLGLGCFLCPWP